MNRLLLVLFLILGTASPTWGQTSAELDAKYRLVKTYEVRPGVLMTPKYAADGQVCEMEIEPRHESVDGKISFGLFLSDQLVKELVDELVPEAERGKDLKGWFDDTVDGGFIITRHPYENILVEVFGTTRPQPSGNMVAVIRWKKRTCIQDEPQKRSSASKTGLKAKAASRRPA